MIKFGEQYLGVSVLLGALVYSVVKIYLHFVRTKDQKDLIHSANGYFMIGNALDFHPNKILKTFDFYSKISPVTELFIFQSRALLFSDIALARELLQKRTKYFSKGPAFEFIRNLLKYNSGLFHCDNPTWSRIRRLTAPAFNLQNVSRMSHRIYFESLSLVNQLVQCGRENEDVINCLKFYAVNVISSVAFGTESNMKQVKKDDHNHYFASQEYIDSMKIGFQATMEIILFPLPYWMMKYIPFYRKILDKAVQTNEVISNHCKEIIKQKKQEYNNSNNNNNNNSEVHVKNNLMIDLLMKSNLAANHHYNEEKDLLTDDTATIGGMTATDDEVIENIKTFYIAGSETTAVTTAWCLYYISLHSSSHIRTTLRQETDEFFKILKQNNLNFDPFNTQSTKNLLQDSSFLFELINSNLKYCTAVIKEATRLSGPVSYLYLGEMSMNESYVLSNGVKVLKGNQVFLYVDGIHKDEKIFENPQEFQPSRWLIEDQIKLQAMESSYLEFSSGPRVCPGMILALLEVKLALASIIYHLDMELLCPEDEIHSMMNLARTPSKLPMKFVRRS
eukprot:gene14794-19878_t